MRHYGPRLSPVEISPLRAAAEGVVGTPILSWFIDASVRLCDRNLESKSAVDWGVNILKGTCRWYRRAVNDIAGSRLIDWSLTSRGPLSAVVTFKCLIWWHSFQWFHRKQLTPRLILNQIRNAWTEMQASRNGFLINLFLFWNSRMF